MANDSGYTESVWMSTPLPDFCPLQGTARADVCIVGAGIAGLTTAYLLVQQGQNVVVLEDGPIARGASSRTTGHLTAALDDRYFELERLHGLDGARIAAHSHNAAIDLIEGIVAREDIDCDFERVDGYLFVPPGESADVLTRELEAVQRAGLLDVELVPTGPANFFDTGPCLRFRRQAQFHSLKYLSALARAITRRGGKIYTHTHVSHIDGDLPGCVSTRDGAHVIADAIVVATNTPISNRVVMHTKQAAYLTYVIGLRVPRGSVAHVLAWDTPDPYHYVRVANAPDSDDEILIVGGEDHKTGQTQDTEEPFNRLEAWARQRFPMAREIAYRWSGQVMEPMDGMAFIGRNPMDASNVYIVTGDSGNGLTHGTIGGMLITDLIMDRENPWAKLYSPNRKPLRALGDFARENANVVAQYSAHITHGEVETVEAIAPGQGAVLRRGIKKIAAYRDEEGEVHTCSAVCPHLGCVVGWNQTERTWDCPCHGSRFDAHGHVINGPANVDLTPVEHDDVRPRAPDGVPAQVPSHPKNNL